MNYWHDPCHYHYIGKNKSPISNDCLKVDIMSTAEMLVAKGEIKGIREGEQKTRISIARNLKALGTPTEQICQATGLSAYVVEKLCW